MLQQIVSLYRPDERHEIEEELEDSETQIAHPEKFKPHKFKGWRSADLSEIKRLRF